MGQNKPIHTGLKSTSPDQRGWVVQLGFLDSSRRVFPCLEIGINCRCRGLDRLGLPRLVGVNAELGVSHNRSSEVG